MNRIYFASAVISLIFATAGCGSNSTAYSDGVDTQSNTVQSALSQASSEASASETTGSVGFDLLSACTYSTVRSACAASADTITWNSCTVDFGAITMTGGWNENFSGASSATCTVPVVNTEVVTRTSAASVMTFIGGSTLSTDTNGGTAWDTTPIPSSGTTTTGTGGATGRNVVIGGTHRVLKGPRGTTLFDHFIETTTQLAVSGTRAGGTRSIATGVVKVFHNLAKYNASASFAAVDWATPTCCYPTSGVITTTFTGSLTGTSTLTFTATCGQATYVDTSGNSGTLTLNQCGA